MTPPRCEGKIAYPTKAAAERGAKKLRKVALDASRVNVYECTVHVGKWHVGNKAFSRRAQVVLRGLR